VLGLTRSGEGRGHTEPAPRGENGDVGDAGPRVESLRGSSDFATAVRRAREAAAARAADAPRAAAARDHELEELVADRTASLREANRSLVAMGESLTRSRAETVRRLAGAIAVRSGEAGAHSERMGAICASLAARLGLDPARCDLIGTAGALHDVGKLAIPDVILDKPGPLTRDERRVMETHAEIGHRMLAGSGEPLLDLAAVMARSHHERVDGSGYPYRLRGERIPAEGRIAAVADVFDALTNARVFRPAFGVDQAMEMITAGAGAQFDADVVGALHDVLAGGGVRAPGGAGRGAWYTAPEGRPS